MNGAANGLETRVFLRPIGSPLTLGLSGLGAADVAVDDVVHDPGVRQLT